MKNFREATDDSPSSFNRCFVTHHRAEDRMESKHRPFRLLWLTLGVVCVALGAIGAALPLLPTTPFLLVAAFAFARSSQRWHDWLHQHRSFGPLIRNWNEYGALSRKTKLISVASMLAAIGLAAAMGVAGWVIGIQAAALSLSALFVLTRPVPPEE